MNISIDNQLLSQDFIVSGEKLEGKKIIGYVYLNKETKEVKDLNDKKVEFSRKNIQSKRDNLAKIQGKVESDKKSEKKADENNKDFEVAQSKIDSIKKVYKIK